MTKKMGRPTLRDKALTSAEKQRRQRARTSIRRQVAGTYGYTQQTVLLSNKQLKSLAKFSFLETKEHGLIGGDKINDILFHALKAHLKSLEQDYLERGHSPELVKECAYSDDKSNDFNNLMQATIHAAQLFQEWEQQQ